LSNWRKFQSMALTGAARSSSGRAAVRSESKCGDSAFSR
jgi:hypothetical protein